MSQRASQKLKMQPDAEAIRDHEMQYDHGPLTEAELDEKYPNRPRNHSKTPLFSELFLSLFNPLLDNKKNPSGLSTGRMKKGPGSGPVNPQERRREIIQRFISKWRSNVGNDFYPALRLVCPDKDRDRPMYGLKENAIANIIVKLLKINKASEDGQNLLKWKLPGQSVAARLAGDFPGRCYDVLKKRATRTEVGDMRIAEVNAMLDELSSVSKQDEQLPIFQRFYNRMNSEEMHWLIRIILRQMKIGASEKVIIHGWHPDGEALFNVSSSLRRVCWELTDPLDRLEEEDKGITLMECFQPQLAQFQMHSWQRMTERLGCNEEHPEFWIEDKLDGERMQLHMQMDESGSRRFGFWSRKGKDYTYLYGDGIDDDKSSLTRFIKDAFDERVKNIILDGEMITWDPSTQTMVGFGTLKSAAISEQRNPYDATGHRPLFRVFDCLYLNDTDITQYVLKDRRAALERVVTDVDERIEKHHYREADDYREGKSIEEELRRVVAESAEGLVLKSPRSMYRLNSRNDDWMKVKPEYMTEFGESLDCVVIGGYYGQGKRGGFLASFLCGLRVDRNDIDKGANPMKCFSFFKVGGGFRAEDYAKIQHQTEGKWRKWDKAQPPSEYIQLGGGAKQYERPDEWIKPCDSVVLEVKAASVGGSAQFGTMFTLRFPRFKKLRDDRQWSDALSVSEFNTLKTKVEAESATKEFKVDSKRRKTTKAKKQLAIAGNDSKIRNNYSGPDTKLFENLNFFVSTEMVKPRKTKAEIQQIIKSNGGNIFQSETARDDIICIADRTNTKVASLKKRNEADLVRPSWILAAIKQAEIDGPTREKFLVPFEPDQMYHMTGASRESIENNVDVYGDSYARDVTPEDLGNFLDNMIHPKDYDFDANRFLTELEEHGKGVGEVAGNVFARRVVFFVGNACNDVDFQILRNQFQFSGGRIAEDEDDEGITDYVVMDGHSVPKELRTKTSKMHRVPRIVSLEWMKESWVEKTMLDEERYVVAG